MTILSTAPDRITVPIHRLPGAPTPTAGLPGAVGDRDWQLLTLASRVTRLGLDVDDVLDCAFCFEPTHPGLDDVSECATCGVYCERCTADGDTRCTRLNGCYDDDDED